MRTYSNSPGRPAPSGKVTRTADQAVPKWVPRLVIAAVSVAIFFVVQPWLILTVNTPTGGDMGAHVLGPAILRDDLLPNFRILGWSDAWFAGFPAFYFYFPLPSLVIVFLDLFLPYGVAFKLVTVAGLVATPAAAYVFGRSLGLDRWIGTMAGVAGGTFVFVESFTILGANAPSTMAGEFSYSWSFALGLFYLAALIKAVRVSVRFVPLAALLLALTALSHVITTGMFVLASIPVLFWKKGFWRTNVTWMWGFAVAGFWALPLLGRLDQTADMTWSPLRAWGELFPTEIWLAVPLAVFGAIWLIRSTQNWAPLIVMTVLPSIYYWLPIIAEERGLYTGTWKLWNGRLLPFWFFGIVMLSGIAVGVGSKAFARRLPAHISIGWLSLPIVSAALVALSIALAQGSKTAQWWTGGLVVAGVVIWALVEIAGHKVSTAPWLVAMVSLLILVQSAAGISFISGWAAWNFSGYEDKSGYDQYRQLMEAVDLLPAGRIQWEANNDMNTDYGTPMALMLFPYWTEQQSMEGLFFESSLTTPFHFINAGEMSFRPSNPIPGLRYHNFDFDRGLTHLELYDVDYYVTYTPEATEEAQAHPDLREVARIDPHRVFALPASQLVDVAVNQPVVFEVEPAAGFGGDEAFNFSDVALDWYDDIGGLEHWVTQDGPESWPRIDDLGDLEAVSVPLLEAGVVTNAFTDNGHIEFDTTAVGVPHLVKVSYFPNWQATGADGPWRAAPSLMMVVPTDTHVELDFRPTVFERVGNGLSLVGIFLLAAGLIVARRRRA